MDIFFFEAFEEEQHALKKYNAGEFAAGYTWKTIQEYAAEKPPAEIISVRTQSVIPVEWAGKIRAVLSRSTGFDHLTAYRRESGAENLELGCLPRYCSRAVAEQAMTLWMALLRKLPRQMHNFKSFTRDGISGGEAAGRRLLVVGVGNIGSEIVKIGGGLGMYAEGVDREEKFAFVNYTSYEKAAPQADIIVAAMDLNPSSEAYFDYARLKQAKPGVIFINIARGEISPLAGLLQLLEEKHLGALGMDVYENEKLIGPAMRSEIPANTPQMQTLKKLLEFDNVILTPHNAFNTREAVERKSEQSIQQLKELKRTGKFIWRV